MANISRIFCEVIRSELNVSSLREYIESSKNEALLPYLNGAEPFQLQPRKTMELPTNLLPSQSLPNSFEDFNMTNDIKSVYFTGEFIPNDEHLNLFAVEESGEDSIEECAMYPDVESMESFQTGDNAQDVNRAQMGHFEWTEDFDVFSLLSQTDLPHLQVSSIFLSTTMYT